MLAITASGVGMSWGVSKLAGVDFHLAPAIGIGALGALAMGVSSPGSAMRGARAVQTAATHGAGGGGMSLLARIGIGVGGAAAIAGIEAFGMHAGHDQEDTIGFRWP